MAFRYVAEAEQNWPQHPRRAFACKLGMRPRLFIRMNEVGDPVYRTGRAAEVKNWIPSDSQEPTETNPPNTRLVTGM